MPSVPQHAIDPGGIPTPASLRRLPLDHSYGRLPERFYQPVRPRGLREPFLVSFNQPLARELNMAVGPEDQEFLIRVMSGQELLPGSEPIAMKYTGHQFGIYNPDLGDGRGLLLGELLLPQGGRVDLHLKGAGTTPFSRGGDGRAVLRSCIREYLASEAMHALGIPTTRALCVIGSQEPVYRETRETGATLLRVATTHVRFGHFEYCYYNRDEDGLQRLADYVVERHFPHWRERADRHRLLLEEAIRRTARLIAAWQAVGFAHGVMNTDNMSILGETFDYGPYAFLDAFQSDYICNHSDYQGRYAFDQQPRIGLWNCQCLAQAMSPLVGEKAALEALEIYGEEFHRSLLERYRAKLGLCAPEEDDALLVRDLLGLMHQSGTDYSIFFRRLCLFPRQGKDTGLRDMFLDRPAFDAWAERYRERLRRENLADAKAQRMMRRHNPKYILRNYMAQAAIERAQQGDFSEVNRLLALLRHPYREQPRHERYAQLPPDWGRHLEISCSS